MARVTCARRCVLSFCAFSMCSLAASSSRSSELSGGLSPLPMLRSSAALGAAPIDLPLVRVRVTVSDRVMVRVSTSL